jgi:hypothetical protein
MTSSRRHPDAWDVIFGLLLISIGLPLAASMLFLFLGAPLVMAGVELLLPRSA